MRPIVRNGFYILKVLLKIKTTNKQANKQKAKECVTEVTCGLLQQKYLLSKPLQKKFADLYSIIVCSQALSVN